MSTDATLPPNDPQDPEPAHGSALRRLRAATEAVAEPLVEGVGAVIGSAIESFRESSGRRARRLGRLGREPLPSLPDLYPDARRARPVEIGLRTVDVAAIRGTAVGGGDQRGADFLPMRKFRGHNWRARWQRLRRAHDAMIDLPPIDVVKYDDGYWIIDGHNRVGLALYAGQVDIDASVVELVPPGGQRTEPLGSLAAQVESSRLVRGRVDAESALE